KATFNNKIVFLGAPTDIVPAALREYGECRAGIPLPKLAQIMKESLFVVTVDNGMGHLAASQRAREFIFYPKVLGQHYILPWGNQNMEFIHMDPNSLNPAQAVWALERTWNKWRIV